ncbi:Ribonuclease H [Melia azedarach]|uniref:Ribonuclease H n=1 Tax=Melia azedarach TaxID=155640 RepID=A0ACC1YJX0_MELAZ|nr:Ribonuclease H [Melia azedarach]
MDGVAVHLGGAAAPHWPPKMALGLKCGAVLKKREVLAYAGVPWSVGRAPKVLILNWQPPPIGWVEVNSDGLAKGNPGPAACGGVFRNHDGSFTGGFGLQLGHNTSYFAEVMGAILAVEIAHARGWCNLWLESDSMLVINLFYKASNSPHWCLRNRWLNCQELLADMNFRCSHTFR